jgi:riboflavin synthase
VKRIGIADTTFARFDMGAAAREEIARRGAEMGLSEGRDFETTRVTVPGIKDLPVACLNLLLGQDYARGTGERSEQSERAPSPACDVAMALGMVGSAAVDKVCGHEASTSIQQAMLLTRKHVIEVFVHEDEARTEGELTFLFDRRTREHALNALWMLFAPQELERRAGTGQRQGFADAGPLPTAK